jgi:hypothetical protein
MPHSGESAVSPKRATGRFITWNRLALALLFVVFCSNVHRALTQSVTTDEAFTYENFVSRPGAGLLGPFDANNHVLNSVCSRLAIAAFGLKAWTLRLPSLLGGVLYLFAAYRLAFLLFGGGAWSALTTALLVTDPFLLDYLSAARGYGIALAFLLLAAYELIRVLESPAAGSMYAAAIYCGLAIAANLTSLFPVAALMIAFIAASLALGRLQVDTIWSEWIVPATLVAFVFLVLPLSRAQPEAFYYGAKDLAQCVHSLVDLSFAYGPGMSRLGLRFRFLHAAAPFALLLLSLAAGPCAAIALRNLHRQPNRTDLSLYLLALAFLVVLGLITAAHLVAGVPYPLTRTGLYLVPLTFLAASAILYRYRAAAVLRFAGCAAALLCLAAFLLQADVTSYAEWRFDSGTKRIARYIRFHNPPQRRLTVRASWVLEPSLNFYRILYNLNWNPVDRSSVAPPADFIVLTKEDEANILKYRLQVVYRDAASGTVLAQPTIR